MNKPRFIVGEEQNKRVLGPLLIGAGIHNMMEYTTLLSIIKMLGNLGTTKGTNVRMWTYYQARAIK